MEFFNAIKNTPLPIVLVLAGIFLIVLAFVTRIGGIVEVQPDQKGPAILIGLLLLVVGIVLNSAPTPSKDSRSNPSTEQSPTQSPSQVSPAEKLTPTSSPIPTNTYREKYERGEYPITQCGKVSSHPVYPIFIPQGSNNSERMTNSFCQDAKDLGDKILVASFSDEEEANMFLEFIRKHFDGAWKGKAQ